MQPKRKDPIANSILKFKEDFEELEDLRSEISSSLITDQNLWLSYDEDAGIERLTLKKGSYDFEEHKHYELSNFFDLPGISEVDMEALAYQEPYLWFCGSMSLKRDIPDQEDSIEDQLKALTKIKLDKNRFLLGCIPCLQNKEGSYELFKNIEYDNEQIFPKLMRGGAESSELHNALMKDEHLRSFMEIPCKDNGFDIEGLAVDKDRIFLGLRGPVISGYAVILEITCDTLNGELIMQQREGEDHLYRKHFVDLAGMGIRELNIDKKGDLYILAGPTMDLDGTISIYKIVNGLEDIFASVVHAPERLFDVARGAELDHGSDKAEGMAFINDKEVLITYDTPVDERLIDKDQVKMDVYSLN